MGVYPGEGTQRRALLSRAILKSGVLHNLVSDSHGPEYVSTSSVLCLSGPSLSSSLLPYVVCETHLDGVCVLEQ